MSALNRLIDLTFRLKSKWLLCIVAISDGAEKCHIVVVLPQIVLGTVLSVQMDLAGQHGVQVVGHIPSGSVELCRGLFFS